MFRLIASLLICTSLVFYFNSVSSARTLKIGTLSPLTGPYAQDGTDILQGVKTAVAVFGSVKGYDEVEVFHGDSACDAGKAAMGVHRLIDYGVDMIIGGYCGAAMQAIFNILRDSNTLFITPFSWNSEITSQNYNKIFRMNPRFETIGLSIEDFMKKNGLNKLAIIQYKYNSLSDQLSNFIVIDIVIEDKQQDYFNNEINQIISSSFDTIFYNVSSTQGSQIMSNLRRRGQFTGRATRPYLLFNGVYAGQIEWESLIGMEDKVYAVGGNIPDYNHSEYNNFKNAYRRLYGELPKNEITFFAYDAAMIYLRAVDKAKTTDKNIIARVIKDSVWSGVTGIISFAPNGDRRIRYALSRLSDGKYIDRICADDECECNTNSCCDKSNGCK